MNRALAVLQQCRQLGIDVSVGDEGDLVLDFNDPPPEWLQNLMLQHKHEIIRILREEHFAGRQCISIEEDRTPISPASPKKIANRECTKTSRPNEN